MPVEPQSPSPEPFERSPSPDYGSRGGANGAGPSKVRGTRFTEHDIQKRKLEKLLANPEKEVKLPEGMGLSMRAPKDTLKNISGSSAAAGSGEFHIYKHSRRREYERVKAMERQTRELEEQAAFMARQAERDKLAESKTAKIRAKRQKRKHAQRGGGGDSSKAGEAGKEGGAGQDPTAKSKFAGGQAPVETKEEANTVAEVQAAQTAAAEDQGGVTRTAEVTITVVDDE